MPSKKEELRHRRQARLDDLIAIDDISAVTDADLSFFRQRQLQDLCTHFHLDVRGTVEALSRRLRDQRDGKPSTPPPEENKQPALPASPAPHQTYAAVAAGTPAEALDGNGLNTTTASPRTIAAVQAVDTLEDASSLAVENSFIEGDLQDLPGTTTATSSAPHPYDPLLQLLASPRLTTRISDVNMPLVDVIRQELAPTATSVQQIEASVHDNTQTLTRLQTSTVTTLAQSVDTLSTPISAFNSGLLHPTTHGTTAPPPEPPRTSQGAGITNSESTEQAAVVDLTAGTHLPGEASLLDAITDSGGVSAGVDSTEALPVSGGVTTGVDPTDPASSSATSAPVEEVLNSTRGSATSVHPSVLYLGWHNKGDGRRTMCKSTDTVEEARLRRNGFMVVMYADTLRDIMQWVVEPPPRRSTTSNRDVRVRDAQQEVEDTIPPPTATESKTLPPVPDKSKKPDSTSHDNLAASTSAPSAYRPSTTQDSHPPPAAGPTGGGPQFGPGFDPTRLDTRYVYRPSQHPIFTIGHQPPHVHFPSDGSPTTAPPDPRTSSPDGHMPTSPQHVTPSRSPANPYASVYFTPLQDKSRQDANDFYLSGREGLNSVNDFHYAYYSQLGLPGDTFSEVQYMYSDLLGFWTTPNVRRDKITKSFKKLSTLNPAEFLDFYAYLSNELIHYNIALMPFDAIEINYGYVGLCFPGVGERRYLQMTTEAFRVFDYAFPHEETSVQVASRKHGGHKPDGYRFLWDVMCQSQPVFATFVPNRQPLWHNANGDILLHAKRWLAYFRFEAKRRSYATDVQKSQLFLRSIHDPTLLGTIKSLEMSIMTYEAQHDTPYLPHHLQVQQLADSLTLTTQPLDSELTYAPSGNHFQQSHTA